MASEGDQAEANHRHNGERSTQHGRGRGRGRARGNSRGSRGGGGNGGRRRNKEMGRAEWSKNTVDKRARNAESQQAAKKRRLDDEDDGLPIYATKYSKEEIEAEEKKPKRKVAVMIGYSGSGYKGMQLNHQEKTIEGDLFNAFVAAGAISKANADDPKKSSLVRCARTDKGVHAAGNLISLKLIVEDPDIVAKINEKLSPQIRVWGIERTIGGFSAYQVCDSRIYEYLIPTHCFIPSHPKSFLGKKMLELAEEADDLEGYQDRQKEVANVWSEMEEKYVKPVIEELDPTIRDLALKAFYKDDLNMVANAPKTITEEQKQAVKEVSPQSQIDSGITFASIAIGKEDKATAFVKTSQPGDEAAAIARSSEPTPLEIAIRLLRNAHLTAKKAHRIHPARLARIRSALSRYEGAHQYHNYTIDKSYKDPSATRFIKSFVVDNEPIIINNTEWISLKVHGQSFMMHQIRKMVSMVALLIRCGGHEGRLQDSWDAHRISIPKAPSLGLLLERPVFDVYNQRVEQFEREPIDFGKYEREMEDFKQREIYERIFREEERGEVFHGFFNGLDNTVGSRFLYLSSMGIEATKREVTREGAMEEKVGVEDVESGDGEENEDGKGEGEEG